MPGETGGVNEGLGEGAHGRVKGEGVGRGERGCGEGSHGVRGGDDESRPADKDETGRQ